MQEHYEAALASRQAVYNAALQQLEQLQREIEYERAGAQGRQRVRGGMQGNVQGGVHAGVQRHQLLLTGGLLLGSLLTAVSMQGFAQPARLTLQESAALENLAGYVALRQGADDTMIMQALCAHFEVAALGELESDDYEDAVFYLLRLAES